MGLLKNRKVRALIRAVIIAAYGVYNVQLAFKTDEGGARALFFVIAGVCLVFAVIFAIEFVKVLRAPTPVAEPEEFVENLDEFAAEEDDEGSSD